MPDQLSLAEQIDAQIRATGPMSVATYMQLCLSHPREGYYSSGDPLGRQGDFITAPEISQMFGELIGFFLVNLWQQMGEPPSFTLLELGPGRGTLMQDALRVAARADGFLDAMHLQLFESNPDLKAQQQQRLGQYSPYWADAPDEVAEDPLLVVANEFFDALPIRQYVRVLDGWRERLIGLLDDKRIFGLAGNLLPDRVFPTEIHPAEAGAIYEFPAIGVVAMSRLAERIKAEKGAILAIDYGYFGPKTGETLQAVVKHAYADPLADPGSADLSAHVDFFSLAGAASRAGLKTEPLATQGEFLTRLGIRERAAALQNANPAQSDEIGRALHRLIDPDQMGTLFKAFCVHSEGIEPAGFR